eukprot:gene11287-13822_t
MFVINRNQTRYWTSRNFNLDLIKNNNYQIRSFSNLSSSFSSTSTFSSSSTSSEETTQQPQLPKIYNNNTSNNQPQQQQQQQQQKPFYNNNYYNYQKSTPSSSSSSVGTTFVSSHYKNNEESVLSYLDRKHLIYRISGQEIIIKECPFCPDTKGKFDNLWKLYISRETSAYFCHRCGNKGSWFDLKVNLGDLSLSNMNTAPFGNNRYNNNNNNNNNNNQVNNSNDQEQQQNLNPQDLKKLNSYSDELQNHPDIVKKLTGKEKGERGLSLEVLKYYRVGVTSQSFFENDSWQEHKCITFPWTMLDKKGNVMVHRCKLRSAKEKSMQRIEPKGGKWGFFGWHTVPTDAKEIIITEGEYDAMAVYQETKIPTISLPNGAHSLHISLLPMLERFERIYLWMDDDVPGQEGAVKFSEKLGIKRTYIVHTKLNDPNGPKDANDALLMGKDFKEILKNASNVPHDQICDFSDVRTLIHSELKDPLSVLGVQSEWFPTFNQILKGHRKGELTVFSGPTGIGKTSFLSQLSLDFCRQGVRTLWGSFEVKVPRLAKKMLMQYSNVNLEKNIERYGQLADQFSNIPLYFLRFFGSTHVDKVLDAMEYAVYVQDVEHIILDNLQFMLSGQAKGIEKFDAMDEAIEKLRKFATLKNIHITIVIHPRKQELDSLPLNINDIFGSAKATQESDNVIILQQGKSFKYLDIKKNRFSGDLGTIPLSFDKETGRFIELNTNLNTNINNNFSNNNNNNNLKNNNNNTLDYSSTLATIVD